MVENNANISVFHTIYLSIFVKDNMINDKDCHSLLSEELYNLWILQLEIDLFWKELVKKMFINYF